MQNMYVDIAVVAVLFVFYRIVCEIIDFRRPLTDEKQFIRQRMFHLKDE